MGCATARSPICSPSPASPSPTDMFSSLGRPPRQLDRDGSGGPAQGTGMWGHPETLLTCVGLVARLGSEARGEETKQIESLVSLMAWPPARIPVWEANGQAATPDPPRAGSGRLRDQTGNRSLQTHLAMMGALSPVCPPPGTPCRDGQLGTRQDASVKGGLTAYRNPPPSCFSITQPLAGWWAACQAGRK